ncbi:hypothetical protein V3C99_006917 [Haemonchus contortus]
MLEKDLANSLREIHAQIKVAKTLGIALKHHLDDKVLEGARAGEQVLLINRFLRTALVARESMWGYTQRFLTVDSLYQRMADSGDLPTWKRTKWLEDGTDHDTRAKDLIPIIHGHMKTLVQHIEVIEKELAKAENRLQMERGEQASTEIMVREMIREEEEREKTLTDDEYMDRLIEENSEEEGKWDDEDSEIQNSNEEPCRMTPESEWARLEKTLRELEYAHQYLPQRKIRWASPNKRSDVRCTFCASVWHFSDSCPTMTDEDERFRFVQRRKLCQYCLEDCDPNKTCPRERDECFYCNIIWKVKSLRFLIPNDNGHHRALCNIPNSKNLLKERIQEVKGEMEKMERAF